MKKNCKMDYVERLLKGRRAAAGLELRHCNPDKPEYDEPRANLKEEINQIKRVLLILDLHNTKVK